MASSRRRKGWPRGGSARPAAAPRKPGHGQPLVGGQSPGGQVRDNEFAPLVFGGGEIVGRGGDGEEIAGEKNGDADDNQAHGEHRHQFGGV